MACRQTERVLECYGRWLEFNIRWSIYNSAKARNRVFHGQPHPHPKDNSTLLQSSSSLSPSITTDVIYPVLGITSEYKISLTAFSSTLSPSSPVLHPLKVLLVNWRRTIQLANKVLCGCGKRFSGGGRCSTGWSHSRILGSLRSIQTTLYHPHLLHKNVGRLAVYKH